MTWQIVFSMQALSTDIHMDGVSVHSESGRDRGLSGSRHPRGMTHSSTFQLQAEHVLLGLAGWFQCQNPTKRVSQVEMKSERVVNRVPDPLVLS